MSGRARRPAPDSLELTPLKAAPRGFLLHYILHSLSVKPKHGYEILQDIYSKTGGAWRPGVGSVYPILKKLNDRGFVKADEQREETRKVYSITDRGTELMKCMGEQYESGAQRWMAMRKLYFDMLDPAGLSRMFLEGSRKQFEMTRELFESRKGSISGSDAQFMLREYSVNLERQLEWTQTQLRGLRVGPSPRLR